jgi:pSer/pThr/pTyr-binding forkhead associated (FHA) protein
LESLDYIKDNNNIKIIHIVQLNDQEINIGRNFDNDIIDDDSSVSREHAVIKYNKYNQSLFLENRNGRYGTLVLVRGNIKVSKEKTFFQIGNTHISMELKNKLNFDKIGKESFQYNIIYDNKDNGNDNQW